MTQDEQDAPTRQVCAWCDLEGETATMIPSVERGPDGEPKPVFVHADCLDDWSNRTDAMAWVAP